MVSSPFPGMDPFLEVYAWGDFHASFNTYLRDAVNARLPDDLRARTETGATVIDPDGRCLTSLRPDVYVAETGDAAPSGGAAVASAAVALEEPIELAALEDDYESRWIEIHDRDRRRLVSVIEVLSPANKRRHREDYLERQAYYLAARVNLLEIDLLIGGDRVTRAALAGIPRQHRSRYHASVTRAAKPEPLLYRIPLERPLPTIKLPLREDDDELAVELQAVFETAYERGRYRQDLRRADLDELPADLTESERKLIADVLAGVDAGPPA